MLRLKRLYPLTGFFRFLKWGHGPLRSDGLAQVETAFLGSGADV